MTLIPKSWQEKKTMAVSGSGGRLYRELCKEFQRIHSKRKLKDAPAFNFIQDQFRKYKVTSEKHCRGKTEVFHIGETYLCLLQSVRKHQEIHEQFAGQGERTVEASAALVGLKLPKQNAGSPGPEN